MIQTKRLDLVPIDPLGDLERYLRWLRDPKVTRFLENRFFPTDMPSLRAYVHEKNSSSSALLFGIHVLWRGGWIGNIKLEPIDYMHRRGEIGIMIGSVEHWGKGYATEAIGALTRYAFRDLGLSRLTAGCYAQNVGSRKAFEKNGFQQEGLYRQHIWCDGRFHDEVLLGLLYKDWIHENWE